MTLRITIGIDPGLSGSIVTLADGVPDEVHDMPTVMHGDWKEVDGTRLAAILRGIAIKHSGAYVSACVEKVGARPTDGGTSAFRFGESSGKVKAVLEALRIPYSRVVPAVWKHHFRLLKQDKDASRLLAIKLFPSAADQLKRKKDNGRADALLLALWHDSTQNGELAA